MGENIGIQLNEHMKNVECLMKTALERFEALSPSSNECLYPQYLNDIKELTLNSVTQACKRFEIERKLKNIHLKNNSVTYANTLKNIVVKNENEPEEVQTPRTENSKESRDGSEHGSELDNQDELKGQRTLLNHFHIYGISEEQLKNEQLQMEIVRKLCKKLKAKVSAKDIETTFVKKNALIVKLLRVEDKDKILECAEDMDIWTNNLYDLPKGHEPSKIKICHYMTPHYSKMWFLAEKFKNQGRLHSFKLTDKGLAVVRKQSCNEKIFLSEQQLVDFIKNDSKQLADFIKNDNK